MIFDTKTCHVCSVTVQDNRSIELDTKTKVTLKETQHFLLFTFVYACRSISISVYECFIFPIHVIEIFGVIDLTMFHLCFRIYFASTKVFVHWKDLFFKFLSAFEYEKQYHEPKLQINNLLSFIFNDKRRRVKKVKIIVCALFAYFAHARWHFLLMLKFLVRVYNIIVFDLIFVMVDLLC